ncbi:hypothetical protein EAI_11865, partial [Harpegnathos saltator]
LLTIGQKRIQMRISQACLAHFNHFKQNKMDFNQ